MKLELKPSIKIVVVFEDKEYAMHRPKLGAALEFEEKLEAAKAGGTGGSRLVVEFVTECGLPLDVVNRLDLEQLQEVVAMLTPSKKN